MFRTTLLAAVITAHSMAAHALEEMDDGNLALATGQDGLTVTITAPVGGIRANFIWHDMDGYSGATQAGALVIGDPLATGGRASFNLAAAGGIVLDLDATGDVMPALAGDQASLRLVLRLPGGMVINTGALSVASSNPTSFALSAQSATFLDNMTITIGAGMVANLYLGSEPENGAMMMLDSSLTGGISIANFRLRDTGSTGAFSIANILIDDAGVSSNLAMDINVDATSTGMLARVNSLGGAGGIDITMSGISLGSTASMGSFLVKGLDLAGMTVRITGH